MTIDRALQVARQALGEVYNSPEEFHQRPGGKADPYRQVTMKMKFGKKDFSGKRPKGLKQPKEGQPPKHPRFNLKFDEEYLGNMESARDTAERVVKRLLGETTEPAPQPRAADTGPTRPQFKPVRESASSSTSVGKAWKKGKKTSGQMVASKPGKLSYREALLQQVNEKLKMKKAGKGQVVAKKPGSVSYRKEDFSGNGVRDLPLEEKMGAGSGIKGGKAKKLLNTIAKKPGAVSYGKK